MKKDNLKLPEFLYESDGEIYTGVHGDSNVTDYWVKFSNDQSDQFKAELDLANKKIEELEKENELLEKANSGLKDAYNWESYNKGKSHRDFLESEAERRRLAERLNKSSEKVSQMVKEIESFKPNH